MKKFALITLIAIATAAIIFSANNKKFDANITAETIEAFNQWSSNQNKIYATPQEKLYRLAVFGDNLSYIKAHNAKEGITYTQGLNQFSDMTYEEFLTKFTGDLSEDEFKSMGQERVGGRKNVQQGGQAVDWTTTGAVNPVQNQGQCGGCWAFAAAASFEAAYFNTQNTLLKFSEQASVDCDRGNAGCNGGSPNTAVRFQKQYGLPLLSDYPYTARDGTCKLGSKKVAKALTYTYDYPSSEQDLRSAVNVGVVYISVYANRDFMNYKNGVFSAPNCSTGPTNHAIAVVGYDAGHTYWKVRNSWGPNWGESGYIRMENLRNQYGTCYMFKRAMVVTGTTQYGNN
jgi:C1A family cysteine protease